MTTTVEAIVDETLADFGGYLENTRANHAELLATLAAEVDSAWRLPPESIWHEPAARQVRMSGQRCGEPHL